MKQTHCYLVIYIRTHGRPAISVHMNKQNAEKEFAEFDKKYWEDSALRQVYEDYYLETVVIG